MEGKWAHNTPSLVLDKAYISKVGVADDTLETVGMPALAHGANHTTNYEFA